MKVKISALEKKRILTVAISGILIGGALGIVIGTCAARIQESESQPTQRTDERYTTADPEDIQPSNYETPVATLTAEWDTPLSEEELAALLETCAAGHIRPSIGLGLIQVESSFDPDAVNPKSNCYGYCQLNPRYFPSGLSPADNIRTGIGYLAKQLEHYDNLEAALTAYNAGHDTGDRTYANMVIAAAAAFEGR